jgi:hypothetical protein
MRGDRLRSSHTSGVERDVTTQNRGTTQTDEMNGRGVITACRQTDEMTRAAPNVEEDEIGGISQRERPV